MEKPWEIDLTVYDDEEALLDGLRRHDRLACTCLLKRFAPRLYHLALQLMASPDEAEDVLQEGLIQACGNIDRFEGRSSLGTWLHRIVRNAALMRLRQRAPTLVTLGDDLAPGSDGSPLVDQENDPAERTLSREREDMLEAAIVALPQSLRIAFVLRDLEGMSTEEAAQALDISVSALKVRLHRARLAIREALSHYYQQSTDGSEERNDG